MADPENLKHAILQAIHEQCDREEHTVADVLAVLSIVQHDIQHQHPDFSNDDDEGDWWKSGEAN